MTNANVGFPGHASRCKTLGDERRTTILLCRDFGPPNKSHSGLNLAFSRGSSRQGGYSSAACSLKNTLTPLWYTLRMNIPSAPACLQRHIQFGGRWGSLSFDTAVYPAGPKTRSEGIWKDGWAGWLFRLLNSAGYPKCNSMDLA